MTVRRVTAGIGRTLVILGVFTLLFVAYQLWGTSLHEARAQNRLEDDFAVLLDRRAALAEVAATATTTTATATTTTTADAATTVAAAGAPTTTVEPPLEIFDLAVPPPRLVRGEVVARLQIPAIDVDKYVVHGVDVDELKLGPGHFPGTPLPGQAGNAAIAGHRTTYGAPFFDFDDLEPGDQIFVETIQGRFEYRVASSEVVEPTRVEVILPQDDNRLTFTTCNPKYSAAERLIVVATLVGDPVAGGPQDPRLAAVGDETTAELPSESTLPAGTETTPNPADDTEPVPTTAAFSPDGGDPDLALLAVADVPADIGGGVGGGGPLGPVVLWGSLCLLVWTAGWVLGRNWQPLPAYAIAAIFFLPALFVFYEQLARLLPENF